MNTPRIAIIALFASLMFVKVFAAEAPPVTGTWEFKDPASGATITFTLNPDGSGKFADEAMRYTVQGDKIVIVADGEKLTYNFKVEGDTLTVSGGDLEKPTAFIRKIAGTKKGLGAKIKRLGDDGAKKENERPSPLDAASGLGGAAAKSGDDKPGDPTAKPASGPIGIWQAEDCDRMEIRANAMIYQGITIPATLTANSLKISANGQTAECPFEVSGDMMKISIGGQPLTLKRVGGGAAEPKNAEAKADAKTNAAADPKSIVGNWDSPDGTVIVRPDGTLRTGGRELKYQLDDKFITLTDDTGFLKIPYKLDGDKLILGTGPTKTLTRAAATPVGAAAGVWVTTESSLDPQFFMSITQYVSLYPDGSVGFAKSEGGATRTAVTEHLERFSSFKNNAGNPGKTYGRWQADANGVTIQWHGAWGNATWQGRFDPKTGKLVFPNSGILNQGSTLAFEKQ